MAHLPEFIQDLILLFAIAASANWVSLRKRFVLTIVFGLWPLQAHPWAEHGKMLSSLFSGLENEPQYADFLNTSVPYESLEDFLFATQNELPQELSAVEGWAEKNVPSYRMLPTALKYTPTQCSSELSLCFKHAIRVNTRVPLSDMVQDYQMVYPQNEPAHINDFSLSDILDRESSKRLTKFAKKRNLADPILVREIIATYVDEPDFGLDINLYDDNLDRYPYQFGTQPIGVAHVPYVSQFLFHASTHNEAKLIKFLSPRLKENYPVYRAYLYFALAHFAKRTDHPYWSARFLSWGLHYVQDLTQPYHSKLFPEYSNEQMLFWFMKKKLGFPRDYEDAQQIIANRHLIIEHILSNLFYRGHEPYADKIRDSLKKSAGYHNAPSCKDVAALMNGSILPEIARNAGIFVNRFDQALLASSFRNPQFNASHFEGYGAMFDDLSVANKNALLNEYSDRLKYLVVYTKGCLAEFLTH